MGPANDARSERQGGPRAWICTVDAAYRMVSDARARGLLFLPVSAGWQPGHFFFLLLYHLSLRDRDQQPRQRRQHVARLGIVVQAELEGRLVREQAAGSLVERANARVAVGRGATHRPPPCQPQLAGARHSESPAHARVRVPNARARATRQPQPAVRRAEPAARRR